jgi:hypothetical protein
MLLGLALIAWQGDWFGLDAFVVGGTWLMAVYMGLSMGVTGWFVLTEVRQHVRLQPEPV